MNNFILLEQLENNGCVPFYHGSIKPHFLEVFLFGIAPIIITYIPKKRILSGNTLMLSLSILICFCAVSWVLGTYNAIMEWCALVKPNITLYMGSIGGSKWSFRQEYFLYAYSIGLFFCVLINTSAARAVK